MRELKIGDRLLLSVGISTAYVTDIQIERGPPSGEAFTTYNFEVADWHTYFVGEVGVWVHNVARQPCEKAFAIWRRFLARESDDYWKAYESAMARLPDSLNDEVKLRLFNETRRGYFNSAADGILPPWRNLGVQNLGHGGDSRILGQNLEAIGIVRPKGNVAAHHIVARNDIRAANVRAILQEAGIDIDEAANGLFLPKSTTFAEQIPDLGPPHTMLHTQMYYDTLSDRLSSIPLSDVRDELQKVASELIAGEFPW